MAACPGRRDSPGPGASRAKTRVSQASREVEGLGGSPGTEEPGSLLRGASFWMSWGWAAQSRDRQGAPGSHEAHAAQLMAGASRSQQTPVQALPQACCGARLGPPEFVMARGTGISSDDVQKRLLKVFPRDALGSSSPALKPASQTQGLTKPAQSDTCWVPTPGLTLHTPLVRT